MELKEIQHITLKCRCLGCVEVEGLGKQVVNRRWLGTRLNIWATLRHYIEYIYSLDTLYPLKHHFILQKWRFSFKIRVLLDISVKLPKSCYKHQTNNCSKVAPNAKGCSKVAPNAKHMIARKLLQTSKVSQKLFQMPKFAQKLLQTPKVAQKLLVLKNCQAQSLETKA